MHDKNSTTPAPTLPPPSPPPTRIKIIVIGPNGGGVRKTKTALLCGSIAGAAGLVTIYVCADPGIGSLAASLKVGGPNHVQLFPEEETGDYAQTLLAAAEARGAGVIVIDLGANAMLNAAYQRTLRKALADFRAGGHETFVMVSLVPGKVGLEEDAAQFARKLERVATIVAVIHGQTDGARAGQFRELLEDYRSVQVPNDEPVILNLVTEAGVTPFDWCSSPPSGFGQAAALLAANLHRVAIQLAMVELMGTDAAGPVLAGLARGRPKRWYIGRDARWQVRDEALTADAALIAADDALRELRVDADDADVLDRARRYITASTERDAAYRLAMRAAP